MSILDFLFGGSALAPGDHLVQFGIPKAYGHVILVAISSIFMIIWKGIMVEKARKLYDLPYPKMYSENDKFNCYQRAHQNTLENYPQFLILLFLAGLEMPVFSALAGLVWIAGRISYAMGYFSGDPKKRMYGGYAYLGLLSLLGVSIKLAFRLIC